jgi:hypothetical protein
MTWLSMRNWLRLRGMTISGGYSTTRGDIQSGRIGPIQAVLCAEVCHAGVSIWHRSFSCLSLAVDPITFSSFQDYIRSQAEPASVTFIFTLVLRAVHLSSPLEPHLPGQVGPAVSVVALQLCTLIV